MKKHDIISAKIQKKLEKQGIEISSRIVRQYLGKFEGKFIKEIQKPLLFKKYRVK